MGQGLIALGVSLPTCALKAPPQFAPYLVVAGIVSGAIGGVISMMTEPPKSASSDAPPAGGASS